VHLPCKVVLEWGGQEEGLLFRAAQGGRLSTQAITLICQRMVAVAGLKVRVSSHSLQIGGATAAMMEGLIREQIMKIGGWSSAAMDRYLHGCCKDLSTKDGCMGLTCLQDKQQIVFASSVIHQILKGPDSLGKQVIRSKLDLARHWGQCDILSIKGTEEGPNSSGLPTTTRLISLLWETELELVSEDTEDLTHCSTSL